MHARQMVKNYSLTSNYVTENGAWTVVNLHKPYSFACNKLFTKGGEKGDGRRTEAERDGAGKDTCFEGRVREGRGSSGGSSLTVYVFRPLPKTWTRLTTSVLCSRSNDMSSSSLQCPPSSRQPGLGLFLFFFPPPFRVF